jgi:hypothetical protein
MKFVKYLAVLTFALCAFAGKSNAQTVQFLGGGSSAIAVELGQAMATSSLTNTPCIWTFGKSASIVARDNRPSTPVDTQGNIYISWSAGSTGTCAAPSGTGINVYSYMNIDSVIGDRCYFEVDSSNIPGCVQVITIAAGTAGANKLPGITDTTGGIPAAIISALNGQHWFAIGTDIRPEDAKFQTYRMFTACGAPANRQPFDQGLRMTYGLGYQTGTPGVGQSILSSFSSASFPVLDFNITGNDPITGNAVPTYSVLAVGAQPMIIAVAPATGTGIGAATDINSFTLTLFYQGVLGRSTDLFGPTTTNPVITLVREPLSGTYNTFEYSTPNTSQFHGSQDDNNCSGSAVYANPMTLQSTNGQILAYRKRVIGTGEMTSTLQTLGAAATDSLGYFFWSTGNAAGLPNVKYLTVDGVDPIQDTYTGGTLPGNGGVPTSNVTFKWLNQGDYSIWSAVRIVTRASAPAGVTNLVTAAQTAPATAGDMIPLSNLKVWKSHYYLPAINIGVSANGTTINPATPNDLCNAPGALAEYGGDAGASTIGKTSNHDFCADFGNINGLINKAN